MKHAKELLAAAAFVGLTLTRLLFPQVGEGMREKLQSALARDGDVAVFRELGKKNAVALVTAAQAAAPTATPAPPTARPQFVSYYIEDAAVMDEEESEQAAEALPEAVTAFLERQAEFSDYAIPANVSYSYTDLPFAYALPVAGRQSSGFGYRHHPILNAVRFHYGTDVAANSGEDILAFADGTVSFAGYDDSYGWHLKLDHGDGWQSHYCHCSKLLVKQGQTVTMGERVALVGATGLATGPHLHFELAKDGVFTNPEYYLNS